MLVNSPQTLPGAREGFAILMGLRHIGLREQTQTLSKSYSRHYKKVWDLQWVYTADGALVSTLKCLWVESYRSCLLTSQHIPRSRQGPLLHGISKASQSEAALAIWSFAISRAVKKLAPEECSLSKRDFQNISFGPVWSYKAATRHVGVF